MTIVEFVPPSDDNYDGWADIYRNVWGVNVIPAPTQDKGKDKKDCKSYWITTWIPYKDRAITDEEHDKFKRDGEYRKRQGMAIIPGKVWFGPKQGKYLNAIDGDNQMGKDVVCELFDCTTLEELSAKGIVVEQHPEDAPHKAHFYFYSDSPFPDLPGLKTLSGGNSEIAKKVDKNQIPSLEIKAHNKGLSYPTPSIHVGGNKYKHTAGSPPVPTLVLSESEVAEKIEKLDAILSRYEGASYLNHTNSDGTSKSNLPPVSEMLKPGYKVTIGNNRHLDCRRLGASYLRKSKMENKDEILESVKKWNHACCVPPISDSEVEHDFYKYSIPYAEQKLKEHKQEDLIYERPRAAKHVSLPSDPMILPHYNNDYFEYLVDCAKKTVKEENALLRQIMYALLSPYSNDPLNLGVLAPTSEGKTYPIMECAKFGPLGREIRIVGSMTPKVLIRQKGVLVDKNMNPIAKDVKNLKAAIAKAKHKKDFEAVEQHKEELEVLLQDAAYVIDFSGTTLLFLEPPRPELWDLIKPILSHDSPEMEHPYVDNLGHGIEVKRIITRGAPACIFCSAKDESRWESWAEIESRFIISSPNMVKPKYLAGNKLIAQKKGLPKVIKDKRIISPEAIDLGKQCFNYLKQQIQKNTSATDSPVWIPYAERLAEILPSDKGSDNRITNRLYSILNMVALVKAHLRAKLIIGNEQLVIATLQDLQEALHVMQNVSGMPPHKLKFYQQYIVPFHISKESVPLTSRDICDFYNANAPKGTPPMNTDRLTKTYLEELVNHSYLEREQNEEKKSKEYVYTPLVDIEEEASTEEQADNGDDNNNPSKSSKLGHFDENLKFSKLLLPENHQGIPEDWLKREILQLQSDRIEGSVFKIIDQNGDEMPIDDFIKGYENGSRGLRLQHFIKVPSRFDASKTVEITASEEVQEEADEEISTEDKRQD